MDEGTEKLQLRLKKKNSVSLSLSIISLEGSSGKIFNDFRSF